MTTRKYSSRSQQSTLTGAITAGATSVTVVNGTTLLGGQSIPSGTTFTLVIDPDTALEEIVDATAVSTNTFTIVRAIDGSSAQAHSAGAVVRHMAIGRDYRDANLHTQAAASYNDGSGNAQSLHGIASGEGDVVGTLKTQTLTNKTLTSPTISNPTITGTSGVETSIVFEGATADAHETTLTVVDPTQDNTITLPNTSGTVVIADATQTLTNKTLTSPTISGSPVITGLSSAGMSASSATPKDYVDAILGSATAAATSAASAATSATSAATSASSASTSASSALTSANSASTSATAAASSATAAASSATAAATSATSSATSETAAATSASSAATSASSASTSASSALTSANSASTSATSSATSATASATSASAAATSATSAATSASSAATSASSALTSANSAATSATSAAGYVVPSQTGQAGKFLQTDGTAVSWQNPAGDIESITATSPLTGGGTSGAITVGIQAGTTAQSGAVQLTDSTASTSTTTAATPNSVKTAYDLADAAVPKSLVDAKGDIVTATADNTPARLAAGTNEHRLVADSGETTGLKYVADTTNFAVGAKGDLLVGTAADTVSALAAGGNGETLVADSSTTTGLRYNPTVEAGKNRIINGAMLIDQRGSAAAAVSINSLTRTFSVDRFGGQASPTDGVFTLGQVADAPDGFSKSLKATVTTADASIGATQLYSVVQQIEDENILDFAFGTANAKPITLSFWVKSSVTGTFGGAIRNGDVSRSFVYSYSISSANTWEKKTITIPGDTSGTWAGQDIIFNFSLGTGADRQNTAGSWYGANYDGVTGQTNLIETLNATWFVTGVQIELGSVATAFSNAGGTLAGELAACQRYYYRNFPAASTRTFSNGFAFSTTVARGSLKFPVTMRTSPTALEQSGTVTDYQVQDTTASTACSAVPAFLTSSQEEAYYSFTVASGLVAGQGLVLRTNSTAGYLGWSAEL